LIAAAGWGFSKSALSEFPPYIFLALRFSIATAILVAISWPSLRGLSKTQFIRAFLTGGLLGVTMLFWILGLDNTSSVGEGAFIVSLTVVVVPIVGRLFFGEKLTVSLVLALFPAIIGLFLLSLKFTETGEWGFSLESTHVFFLLSTLGFAFHVIFTSRFAQSIPTMPLSTVQLLAISLIAIIAAAITEDWPEGVSGISWFWVLCSAVIATTLRFVLQNKAFGHLKPSHASMIFMLEPVWAACIGVMLMSESMLVNQVWGCAFIFSSLFVYRISSIKLLKKLFPGSSLSK